MLHEDKKTSPIGLGFGSVRHSTTTHTALLLRRFDCFHSFLTAPRRSDSVWLGPVPVNDLAAPGRAPTDCCIDSPHRNCRRLAGLGTAEAALEGSAKHGGDGRLDSRKHFFLNLQEYNIMNLYHFSSSSKQVYTYIDQNAVQIPGFIAVAVLGVLLQQLSQPPHA